MLPYFFLTIYIYSQSSKTSIVRFGQLVDSNKTLLSKCNQNAHNTPTLSEQKGKFGDWKCFLQKCRDEWSKLKQMTQDLNFIQMWSTFVPLCIHPWISTFRLIPGFFLHIQKRCIKQADLVLIPFVSVYSPSVFYFIIVKSSLSS